MNVLERTAAVPSADRSRPSSGTARLLAIAACAIIVVGILLRCDHVDGKVFWDDEVIASLHVLGQSERELVIRADGFRSVADLRAVMHPTASLRPISATIATLEAEDPQHPPLYYLLARWWVAAFGDSLTAFRTLSALIGIVALPCMFWFAFELFGSRSAALCATALVAVSPVDFAYSGQIREYGLWLVTVLLASALFVRALRMGSIARWLLYTVTLAASLYVFPESLFVAAAHAGVVLFTVRTPRDRLVALGAIALGCLLFVPWAIVMVGHLDQIDRGMATIINAKMSSVAILRTFAEQLRLAVFDLDGRPKLLSAAMTLPVLVFVGYAVASMRRSASDVRRWMVWLLIAGAAIPAIVPDLLTGGDRTAGTRYFLPLFLAIDIALVDLFVRSVLPVGAPAGARRAWLVAFGLVFALRLGSCVADARAQTWWTDYDNRSIAIGHALSSADRPLLMGDDYLVWALSISEYADPRVRVALNPRCYLCTLPAAAGPDVAQLVRPDRFGSVFLLGPSQALRQHVSALLERQPRAPAYRCIDIRDNCPTSDLKLF